MHMSKKIVLASGSPRRKTLLEWAEVSFDVIVKPTNESYPGGLAIEEVPVHIARQKALAVAADLSGNELIIAADTIVVLGSEIIGKPTSRENAIEILSKLAGQTHRVITGVVLMDGAIEKSFSDSTTVHFHDLTSQQIEFYVDKYKPYDKAGAYAIQEWIGVVGIKRVEGDFYNVMGLPVSRVMQALQTML
jgi:septum formation protein